MRAWIEPRPALGRSGKHHSATGLKLPSVPSRSKTTGTDIEKAGVELEVAGADRARNPWEGHQIVERKPDRFMLANILSVFRRRLHGARPRRFCDAHPLANKVGNFPRRAI